ncbi:MAG: hypothetical protein R3F22_07050 [Lysobacteraceae bacterium]
MIRQASRIVILIILATSISGCRMLFGCGGAEAKKATQLDREYLAKLYAYVASGECGHGCRPPILDGLKGIGNRPPRLEVRRNGDARVKLSVCVDTGAILYFENVGTPDGHIYVAWSTDSVNWHKKTLWSVSEQLDSKTTE